MGYAESLESSKNGSKKFHMMEMIDWLLQSSEPRTRYRTLVETPDTPQQDINETVCLQIIKRVMDSKNLPG